MTKNPRKGTKLDKVHEPVRMCISCQKRDLKKNLVRIVVSEMCGRDSSQGRNDLADKSETLCNQGPTSKMFIVDHDMKAQSRGAYIHPVESCILSLECGKRGSRLLARVLSRNKALRRQRESRQCETSRHCKTGVGVSESARGWPSKVVAQLVKELRSLDAS